MKPHIKLLVLIAVFLSGIILLGANTENAGGCTPPPELTVGKPSDGQNVPNAPVTVEFSAKQGTWDWTAVDPTSVQVQLLDNLNNLIDVTKFIATNCDLNKKNCSFAGDVSIPDATYTLTVKVCNQAAACSTKNVTFVPLQSKRR